MVRLQPICLLVFARLVVVGIGPCMLSGASPGADATEEGGSEMPDVVRDIVAQLQECPEVKPRACAALDDLISIGDPAIALVAESYRDLNAGGKTRVGQALGFVRLPTAANTIVELLANETVPDLRGTLLLALGRTEQISAFPILRDALTSAEVGEKIVAATALGILGSELAVPALMKELEHFHPKVKQAAISALGRLKAQEAAAVLMDMLGDPRTTWTVRKDIVRTLARLNIVESVPLILLELGHAEPEVRREACAALGELSRRYAVFGLFEALRDVDTVDVAALALGKLRDDRAIEPLSHAALNPNFSDFARTKAIWAMGNIGSKSATESLTRLFASSNDALVSAAVDAVGRVGDDSAVDGLIRLLEHKNADVRDMAVWALTTIARQDFGRDPSKWREWALYGRQPTEIRSTTPAVSEEHDVHTDRANGGTDVQIE